MQPEDLRLRLAELQQLLKLPRGLMLELVSWCGSSCMCVWGGSWPDAGAGEPAW